MIFDVSSIVSSISGVIGKFITRKEDQTKAIAQITSQVQQYAETIEKQITERHKSDMMSDSWLSKNIRPLSLISLVAMYIVFSIADGRGWIEIDSQYITLLGQWGQVAMSFYFGGRSIEKIGNAVIKRK